MSVLERAGGAVAAVEKASIDEVYVDVTRAAQALLASLPSAVGDSPSQQQKQQQQMPSLPCAIDGGPGNKEPQQPRPQQLEKRRELKQGELEQEEFEQQVGIHQGGGLREQDLKAGASEEASSPKGEEGRRWEEIGEGGWAAVLAEVTGTHVSEDVFGWGVFTEVGGRLLGLL